MNKPTPYTPAAAAAITAWQNAGYVHPLTCGTDSGHANLVPEEAGGMLVLLCPTCGYQQSYIPECCLNGPGPNPFASPGPIGYTYTADDIRDNVQRLKDAGVEFGDPSTLENLE